MEEQTGDTDDRDESGPGVCTFAPHLRPKNGQSANPEDPFRMILVTKTVESDTRILHQSGRTQGTPGMRAAGV